MKEKQTKGESSEERRRWFDPTFKIMAIKVLPGEHYVSVNSQEMIVTVLGSCVAACVWDPLLKLGGMNHFMLPHSGEKEGFPVTRSLRYGNFAMEELVNEILSRGGRRDRLEVKIFGGANVISTMGANGGSLAIGSRNADFARRYLRDEQLYVVAQDLGGNYPRRIHFFPRTGKVVRLFLRKDVERSIITREMSYEKILQHKNIEGDVELFGD